MADDRVILHSDMNSFYASVEMMLDPRLKGKAVAVCRTRQEGWRKDRNGKLGGKTEMPRTDTRTAPV